jgi:2-polyprenyl-3-methyl-5-hydroxy-6-metoxy-1,4-benzoquinol methylase
LRVDFERTAADYAAHRADFPEELFVRLRQMRVGTAPQRIVDMGTGTGSVARGFARAGCQVTGVDVAPGLLEQARRLDAAAGRGATLPEAAVVNFDRDLANLLAERFPADPLDVPHRIWAMVARAPG